jgi:BirA family biotin operon repressor/biotin-[acetyl-CoA-carboxylase] ligase
MHGYFSLGRENCKIENFSSTINPMSKKDLLTALKEVPVPSIKYYKSIGSTNSEALTWAENGAAEYSLVFADCQTAGRGRLNRRWVTHPGAGLAFSIILNPTPAEAAQLALFSPLGAMAVASVLTDDYSLSGVEVKWPNDVLIQGSKVCGVLAESLWLGNHPQSVIIGIGINITPLSLPPAKEALFPAVCIESVLERSINRFEFLAAVLRAFIDWRPQLGSTTFTKAWEQKLAYKGEFVQIIEEGQTAIEGQLMGVSPSGHLLLMTQNEKMIAITSGDVHLRLAARNNHTHLGE